MAADRFRAGDEESKSVGRVGMSEKQRFDDWPERYDRWFETPVGKAVLKYETELILEMLRPGRESIGCKTEEKERASIW